MFGREWCRGGIDDESGEGVWCFNVKGLEDVRSVWMFGLGLKEGCSIDWKWVGSEGV